MGSLHKLVEPMSIKNEYIVILHAFDKDFGQRPGAFDLKTHSKIALAKSSTVQFV